MMSSEKTYKVPPDGGYGWVVSLAYGLNNVVMFPLLTGFGLVFQEAFEETGLSASQGSLVLVLNHGLALLLSFFGGPVLRRFGYRKVAIFGATLVSTGLFLTALSNTFWMFVLSYSIINCMGLASLMAAFSLAINSFFKRKIGRAMGLAMSITGLGAICMPLLMSALLYAYGWRYTVIILSAICLHSLLAACLLRPVKWYHKNTTLKEEEIPLNNDPSVAPDNGSVITSSKHTDVQSLPQLEESMETSLPPPESVSLHTLINDVNPAVRNAASHPNLRMKAHDSLLAESRYRLWESQEINLGSSINIFNESHVIKNQSNNHKIQHNEEKEEKPKSNLKKIVDFFDLTLLSDPIYVNILFGLSMASSVEINFSLLLPLILKDMLQFETTEIARVMAVIGFTDTVFRLTAPFIGERLHMSPRFMCVISLALSICVRIILLFTTSFIGALFLALTMGVIKGVRTVYMNIVLPSYVPLERLPFASGIQMFFKGIVAITTGSLIGRIRDISGSYKIPILFINFATLLCVISWSAEFLYFRLKNKTSKVTNT